MSSQPGFVNPFHRPRCLAAAAPAGKAKLTHPGKAILAGTQSFVVVVCLLLLFWPRLQTCSLNVLLSNRRVCVCADVICLGCRAEDVASCNACPCVASTFLSLEKFDAFSIFYILYFYISYKKLAGGFCLLSKPGVMTDLCCAVLCWSLDRALWSLETFKL